MNSSKKWSLLLAMRKKILTSLPLIFIVSAMLFSAVKIEPVKASTEQIVNGGFESGFYGWTKGGDVGNCTLETVYRHAGVYCVKLGYAEYANWWSSISQNFAQIAVSNITSFKFWVLKLEGGFCDIYYTAFFTDGNSVEGTTGFSPGVWCEINFGSWLNLNYPTRTLIGFRIRQSTITTQYIDDVSLMAEPPHTSLLTIRALDPQGNNVSMPFMLDGMWNSTFFSYDMALANYSISFPSAWNFNETYTWNFINWTDYGGGGYFYTERIIIFTEETQYTVYYSISRNWDPGGWVNFIIGLIGFGLMFFSWIFGYGLWKDDEYAKAIGVWLGMFTIGLGIFTVMLGG